MLAGMPTETLAAVAPWLFITLIACLVWFALRIVGQLDKITDVLQTEFHKHDLRLAKLEAWRDGLRYPKEDMDRRTERGAE